MRDTTASTVLSSDYMPRVCRRAATIRLLGVDPRRIFHQLFRQPCFQQPLHAGGAKRVSYGIDERHAQLGAPGKVGQVNGPLEIRFNKQLHTPQRRRRQSSAKMRRSCR